MKERPEEGYHFRGKGRRFCDGGDDLEFQMRIFGGCLGIDLLLGNEQEWLMALGEERFGDGDAGEEVAAGATTGDDDFHDRVESDQ